MRRIGKDCLLDRRRWLRKNLVVGPLLNDELRGSLLRKSRGRILVLDCCSTPVVRDLGEAQTVHPGHFARRPIVVCRRTRSTRVCMSAPGITCQQSSFPCCGAWSSPPGATGHAVDHVVWVEAREQGSRHEAEELACVEREREVGQDSSSRSWRGSQTSDARGNTIVD